MILRVSSAEFENAHSKSPKGFPYYKRRVWKPFGGICFLLARDFFISAHTSQAVGTTGIPAFFANCSA